MNAENRVIRSRRVVLPDGVGPAQITIRGGRISGVAPLDAGAASSPERVLDFGDDVVMPGLVDTHVHINEPGRADWEGFEAATRAAAAGGITTLIDMPLNSSPVTTAPEALRAKAAAAQRARCLVDYGFWGGVVPGNADQIPALLDAGVAGFKCFMVHSGIDEFPNVTEADLREAMPLIARRDSVLLAHAELPGPIDAARAPSGLDTNPRSYAAHLASRPQSAEVEAIDLLVRLCAEFRCRVHIVHLSAADALSVIAGAMRAGLPISVETCPHYLALASEEIADGATPFKCAPPIRDLANRDRLWAALREGLISMVVSDHSPCPPDLKRLADGDFSRAWGGIASLQLGLPIMWTHAARRGFSFEHLAEWMCRRPGVLAGLAGRKGAIRVGYDADLVVWNPDESFVVDPSMLHHRHKITPYAGMTLRGTVKATFLRGQRVFGDGAFSPEALGRRLRPGGTSTPDEGSA